MPRPRAPAAAADFVAAQLAAGGISADQVDPDYLDFLRHASALERPARGRPDSPPLDIKCEQPDNGAPVPSPPREGRDRRVGKKKSTAEIPTGDMDELYRLLWEHSSVVDGMLVLEIHGEIVNYGAVDMADGPLKGGEEAAARAASRGNERGVWKKEKEKGKRKGKGKGKVAATSTGRPALKPGVRDSPAHRRKSRQGEKDRVKNGAKKMKVEDEVEKSLTELPVEVQTLNIVNREMDPSDDGHDDAKKIKLEEEEEMQLTELSVEVQPLDTVNRESNSSDEMPVEVQTLNTVNRETNPIDDGHDVKPQIDRGLDDVVWPTHIMERPDSEFKERLMHVLRKPFSQEEYDMLLGDATIRLPATKKRQTRSGVKYYDSTHEKTQSYFDLHPDFAKQVQSTSCPNQLALLRGFFFWLENITNEDQFRPWRDDFRLYKIVPFKD